MRAPAHRVFTLLMLATLAGCGGGPASAVDTLAAAAARERPLDVATTVPTGYDLSTGQLSLSHLALSGSTTCYDATLRTLAGSPIRVELGSAQTSGCDAVPAVRYDSMAGTLSISALRVGGGGSEACYDVAMRTVQPAPLQLELVAAAPVACPAGPGTSFVLTSPLAADGGTLPADYTCDGPGSSLPLAWTQVPAGTKEFALLMTTLPGDGSTKWNWVLYNIPASASTLARDAFGVGTAGVGSDGPFAGYQPPCSQGPGAKRYTWTLFALSGTPALGTAAGKVTGDQLAQAIAPLTLGTATLNLNYSRTTASPGSSAGCLLVRNSLAAIGSGQATASCDATYAYVGGNGLALHTMMDGITATNLQVPTAQNFFGSNAWKIPLQPKLAASTTTAVDGPIGVAVNGVPIFNPCKQGGCQNGDTKVLGELDLCNGHAGRADDYHYHAAPTCLMATKPASYWNTHPLGWALDGFAIYGYNDPDGNPAARDGLCGGNTGPVSNGPAGYSYHVTEASPYVLSCFRGTPSPDLAGQGAKYSPMRKPPVTPFAVSAMTLSTDANDGFQVLQFTSARSFTTTETGSDSYVNAPGGYRIRYKAVSGAALDSLLAQPANRGKSACWSFQFTDTAGRVTQPATTYCR